MAEATAAQKGSAPAVATEESSSLLDQIVEQGRFGKETASRERGKDLVKEFVEAFRAEGIKVGFYYSD